MSKVQTSFNLLDSWEYQSFAPGTNVFTYSYNKPFITKDMSSLLLKISVEQKLSFAKVKRTISISSSQKTKTTN